MGGGENRSRWPWPLVNNDQLYKVAYDEAVRALSELQAAIESVRARAGLLLSTAAVTTSFLGAQGLQGGRSNFLAWLAMTCFVAVAATCLSILLPRRWEFAVSSTWLVESCGESAGEVEIDDLYRGLAIRMRGSFSVNHQGLAGLALLFQAASGLLTIEVVAWIVTIALHL